MNASIDPNSIKAVMASLQEFEKKVQRKIITNGLRALGKKLRSQIRGNITWNSKTLRRAVKFGVKSRDRGKLIWMGAGVLGSKMTDDDWRIKVKAWAYDGGWYPYPKGRPTNRKGKGWRKGLRRLGGTKIYRTGFISKVYQSNINTMAEDVFAGMVESVKEQNK